MATQFHCPYCGAWLPESERYSHKCAGSNQYEKKCPACGCTGRTTSGTWLGSSDCPTCHGTGKIIYRP